MASMNLSPNDLKDRIAIQTSTDSQDAAGQIVPTWSTYATVWACITPLIGREYLASRQLQAEVSGKIRIRYLAGVTPKMRVLFNGRYFNILTVMDVNERHVEMIIMVKEIIV